MKTIANKTHRPLKIRLHGGKLLHLGPGKSGQIADDAAGELPVRRLIDSGEVEIVGEGASHASSGAGQPSPGHKANHGHAPNTMVLPKGDR
jgi:hypothetical protein